VEENREISECFAYLRDNSPSSILGNFSSERQNRPRWDGVLGLIASEIHWVSHVNCSPSYLAENIGKHASRRAGYRLVASRSVADAAPDWFTGAAQSDVSSATIALAVVYRWTCRVRIIEGEIFRMRAPADRLWKLQEGAHSNLFIIIKLQPIRRRSRIF
jgi:hypothetical protein